MKPNNMTVCYYMFLETSSVFYHGLFQNNVNGNFTLSLILTIPFNNMLFYISRNFELKDNVEVLQVSRIG